MIYSTTCRLCEILLITYRTTIQYVRVNHFPLADSRPIHSMGFRPKFSGPKTGTQYSIKKLYTDLKIGILNVQF